VTKTWNEDAIITSHDLDVLARLMAARFADRVQEQRRLERLDEVNHAAATLSRSLADMNRHALSECRGSHSKWDVGEDSRAFYHSLSAYATLVRELAIEYRTLSAEAVAVPADGGLRRRNLTVV
jgi:hypothetical protein